MSANPTPNRRAARPRVRAVIVVTDQGPVQFEVTPEAEVDPSRGLRIETHGQKAYVSQL
jgi:hypothetical protein